MSGFNNSQIKDVNYGFYISSNELVDHDPEPSFDEEETRLNRDSKTHHPAYNDMQFPDPWDEPVRTITATCSRVSRESIVVNEAEEMISSGVLRCVREHVFRVSHSHTNFMENPMRKRQKWWVTPSHQS